MNTTPRTLLKQTVKVIPEARAIFEMECAKRGYNGSEILEMEYSEGRSRVTIQAAGKPSAKANIAWFAPAI